MVDYYLKTYIITSLETGFVVLFTIDFYEPRFMTDDKSLNVAARHDAVIQGLKESELTQGRYRVMSVGQGYSNPVDIDDHGLLVVDSDQNLVWDQTWKA